MDSVVLDTSELDEHHSAENLAIRLQMVKADWNLEGKIRVCVRDNAFNQAAAGRLCPVLPTHYNYRSMLDLNLKSSRTWCRSLEN